MKSKVQILWDNNQIFAGLDGVVYNDRILTVDYSDPTDKTPFYKSILTEETTIEKELATYPKATPKVMDEYGIISGFPNPNNILEIGLHIDEHLSSPLTYNNGKLCFGSGQMEDDGFVAYITNDNQFIWSISFGIDPICCAEIKESYLYLTSVNEGKAKINLECLTDIEYSYGDY